MLTSNGNHLELMDGDSDGISWAICKSAPRSRQISMLAHHHSFFTGQMPSLPPTNSIKALNAS